ncbi:MAG: transposase [Tannerella sp.]|nr:transposase [Tannerella sp.]
MVRGATLAQFCDCKAIKVSVIKPHYSQNKLGNILWQDRFYHIITDNTCYYRNKELIKWLENTKIKPVFLPPYFPNLNLIERLWKFMRKKVINTCFYRTKQKFRQAILRFFENIDQYKPELDTLLTLNFRLVKSQYNSF